jgi:hypothetical protein
MEEERKENINYEDVRKRCLRQRCRLTDSPDYLKYQIKNSGIWDNDWSELHRATLSQIAWDGFLRDEMPPEVIATLYTPDRLSVDEFRRRVEDWRIESGKRMRGERPPRRYRKMEYFLALEFGPHPKKALYGRLHAHALLWNVLIPLEVLALAWRDLNNIDDPDEPVLKPYRMDENGVEEDDSIGYCGKTLAAGADLITTSKKLRRLLWKNSKNSQR